MEATLKTQAATISTPDHFEKENFTNDICSRLDRMEAIMMKQANAISRAENFEQECNNNLERLSSILLKLEQRTNLAQPRKLDLVYEQMIPRKRQDIRDTPTKQRQDS